MVFLRKYIHYPRSSIETLSNKTNLCYNADIYSLAIAKTLSISSFFPRGLRTFDEEEDDGGDEQEGHDDKG